MLLWAIYFRLALAQWSFVGYIIVVREKNMTEEQKKEELRKVENRVRRWNESVKKVQELQENWKKENQR